MIEDILGVDLGGSKMHFIIYHNGELIEERYPTGVDCTSEPIRDHLHDFLDRLAFHVFQMGDDCFGQAGDQCKVSAAPEVLMG